MSGLLSKIDTYIKWSFYVLFFLVPLIMWNDTFELFEFNKMWVVFGISVLIFFLWGTKMIGTGQFKIRRTPLDIPLALFLVSQIISTVVSMEPHTSFWGYYSRFNGGLLSTISYIFLYYAFATNLTSDDSDTETKPISYRILGISFVSGLLVTLWGLPSHFGYDPTCLVFRGVLDTKCWTEQFQPTVRIFSTLGQPNWLGTYLAALIPIGIGFGIKEIIETPNKFLRPALFLGLTFLYFLALLYTRSQSSFLGLAIGLFVFFLIFIVSNFKKIKGLKDKAMRYATAVIVVLALTTFLVGSPIESLNKYTTLNGIKSLSQNKTQDAPKKAQGGLENTTDIQLGGSQSSDIRLIVWRGALELFKQKPLFGTGVETYAFAYYGVKPLSHNLTSEWDYLYNKAHNEYLNYLATTGIVGLGTYLLIAAWFLFKAFTLMFKRAKKHDVPILLGIVAGYIAILISNFFGFSVVVINLFFFIFPAFFFEIADTRTLRKSFAYPKEVVHHRQIGTGRALGILALGFLSLYFTFRLINFWFADRSYALGYNLGKAGEITQAYTPLANAVKMLPNEDLYKDEQSINLATLAVLFAQNNRATEAAQLAEQARAISDKIIADHPNNIVYYKTRIRVQYALSQLNPTFIDEAIKTVGIARKLAPTDAKLVYNLALFYNQKGDNERMRKLLDEAIRLKPNYYDPYYAGALLFKELAKENPGKSAEYLAEARKNLEYILKNIDPTSQQAKELLESLGQ